MYVCKNIVKVLSLDTLYIQRDQYALIKENFEKNQFFHSVIHTGILSGY